MDDDRKLKTIIREELGKLSQMTWGQRLEYVWEYYKPLMAAILGILFVIYIGVTIYQNKQEISLITVYMVNCNTASVDSTELEEDFAEYIGGLEKHETVTVDCTTYLDSSDTTQYGMASQMKLMAVTAAGEIDLMAMDPDYFEAYAQEGYFGDLRDILSDEQEEKWKDLLVYGEDEEGNEIVTGIDLSDAAKVQEMQLYPGGCICGIMVNSDNTGHCSDFLEWLFLADSEAETAGETEEPASEAEETEETAGETEKPAGEAEETAGETETLTGETEEAASEAGETANQTEETENG